ncbi:MAG: OmpA family protein, partial [Candidatus Cloacimonetes bacterium]|nr:OmpA family protein [Candidatus Cloacimonadota bacterium]
GILDYEDECPNERETFNGYMDEDGCPDTRPEIFFEAEKPLILEGVNFDTGSANLTAEARGILDKVVTALQDYPEVELEIQGHTDDRGSKEFNITLSENRAQSVRTYLVSKGITAERLKAKGYGPDKPIADNNTAEGRAMNRRIEFFKLK